MITLASDFGSPYPAAMKGVIRRHTDAELIDVAHDLPCGDPERPPSGSASCSRSSAGRPLCGDRSRRRHRPRRTRRPRRLARARRPDNGLAMPPARALAREKEQDENIEAFVVDVGEPASETFHGRDVFAPTAARIRTALDDNPAKATPEAVSETLAAMDDLSPATDPVDLVLPDPSVERDDAGDPVAVDGEVLAIDRFGNVVTNVPGELIRGRDWVRINGELTPVAETFGAVDSGDRLVTVGSHGYVECDVNDGRGDGAFDLRPGESVRLVADNVSL